MKSKAVGFGIFFRIILILYGKYQDTNFVIKYTDIDYFVVTDASSYVVQGESPFLRDTYRYTPLLSWMFMPNILVNVAFGKFVLLLFDILCYFMLEKIQPRSANKYLWLWNPFVINMSTRGSFETIICSLVLLTVYLYKNGYIYTAAFVLGISVHFKLYPILLVPTLVLRTITQENTNILSLKFKDIEKAVLENIGKVFLCGFMFLFSFSILTYGCFILYGETFLEEAYFYHLLRKDHRHNFSVYFYPIYLNYFKESYAAFLPQFFVQLGCIFSFHHKLEFCIFLQIFSFVTYNKVITSQYFLWYLSLLPLIYTNIFSTYKEAVKVGLLWFSPQLLWLLWAYRLEFLGENRYFEVWISSVLIFLINNYLIYFFGVKRNQKSNELKGCGFVNLLESTPVKLIE
eukprot:maker-scaffold_4-snap-gene-6.1-mRNA-1 protein AED:0.00 eAED:0.00 QI:0/0.5/0.33/1/0/0/3/209/401